MQARPAAIVIGALAAILIAASQLGPAGRAVAQEHVGVFTQADIVRGSQTYTANCAVCHGLDGSAIAGVDFRRGQFKSAVTDDDVKRVIRAGVPAAGMPPFPTLDEATLNALVAFIRAGLDANAQPAAVATGDAAKGRVIFESAAAACLDCHRVNGRGGRSGPDLSDVGTTRTFAALNSSLVDPTSAMLPINRPVKLTTADGRTFTGRRMNEDTYTVLLSDERGDLRSFDKARLRSFEVGKVSPMPSYKDRLTEAQLPDLLSYLTTLRDAGGVAPNPFGANPLAPAVRRPGAR